MRKKLKTAITALSLLLLPVGQVKAESSDCIDCDLRIGLKTNLLHDALITPDLGIEVSLARRFSLSMEGVYAWWSKDSSHFYWRIRGAMAEMRLWLGSNPMQRALTGHHIGIYGSMYNFDFEFGGRGWQSPNMTYGIGVSYGYSLRINDRMNLDLGLKVGYTAGHLIKYKPQCDTYVCTGHTYRRNIGLTGIDVTLVWFPGRKKKNHPNFNL